jgi:hypothetical protein
MSTDNKKERDSSSSSSSAFGVTISSGEFSLSSNNSSSGNSLWHAPPNFLGDLSEEERKNPSAFRQLYFDGIQPLQQPTLKRVISKDKEKDNDKGKEIAKDKEKDETTYVDDESIGSQPKKRKRDDKEKSVISQVLAKFLEQVTNVHESVHLKMDTLKMLSNLQEHLEEQGKSMRILQIASGEKGLYIPISSFEPVPED